MLCSHQTVKSNHKVWLTYVYWFTNLWSWRMSSETWVFHRHSSGSGKEIGNPQELWHLACGVWLVCGQKSPFSSVLSTHCRSIVGGTGWKENQYISELGGADTPLYTAYGPICNGLKCNETLKCVFAGFPALCLAKNSELRNHVTQGSHPQDTSVVYLRGWKSFP